MPCPPRDIWEFITKMALIRVENLGITFIILNNSGICISKQTLLLLNPAPLIVNPPTWDPCISTFIGGFLLAGVGWGGSCLRGWDYMTFNSQRQMMSRDHISTLGIIFAMTFYEPLLTILFSDDSLYES